MSSSTSRPNNRPLRAAILGQDLRAGGGVASMVTFAEKFLKSRGVETQIFTYAPFKWNKECSVSLLRPASLLSPKVSSKNVSAKGYEQTVVGAYFPELEVMRYLSNSEWERLLSEYDIIQLAVGSPMQAFPALSVKNKKCVLWVATPFWEDRMDRVKSASLSKRVLETIQFPFLSYLEKQVLERVEHVCSLSQYTSDKFREKGFRLKSESLMPYPVNTDLFTPLLDTTAKHPQEVLCAARYNDPRKNIDMLLRAFQQVLQKHPKAKLTLIGDDPKQKLPLLEKLGIQNSVQMLGLVSNEELVERFKHAQVFTLPSKQEGLGIVLLQAMACGLPVVSTRCGGPEMFIDNGRTGYLLDGHTEKEMADALSGLLENPKQAEAVGKAARHSVLQEYSEEAISNKLLSVYQSIYPEHFSSA